MPISVRGDLTELIMARRLLLNTEKLISRKPGDTIKAKSARDDFEEDQALLSGEVRAGKVGETKPQAGADNVDIRLSDLIACFKAVQAQSVTVEDRDAGTRIEVSTKSEVEVSVEYHAWAPVEGLVRRNQRAAETDRYFLEFQDGSTFKITDKWSGKSTTIWGDPHVDTSDEEGSSNGEFSDLKSSDTYTTLVLEDGTRVTFKARDNGVIEEVDLIKGKQHLHGIGGASIQWNDQNGLFARGVRDDGDSIRSLVPVGDVVYAGGDGNDWFDAAGRLIWGAATGIKPLGRPSSSWEISVRRTYEQAVRIVPINLKA